MEKNKIEKKEKKLFFVLLAVLVVSLVVVILNELWKFFVLISIIGILYLVWKNPGWIKLKK